MLSERFKLEHLAAVDQITGLMWTLDAALSEFPLTWLEALEFINALNTDRFAGYGDWRLPNRRELFSLVSHRRINPALPEHHPFENVFHGYYWTSTTCARLTREAWYVHLGGAKVYRGMKYVSYMLWPVRTAENGPVNVLATGQRSCYDDRGDTISCSESLQDAAIGSGISWSARRFVVDGQIVFDRLTGLTWPVNATVSDGYVDWHAAHDLVAKLNDRKAFGYDDWRMPGIRELESLVDLGAHTPALPTPNPFNRLQLHYWSATTSQYENRYAWALYLQDGAVGVGFKEKPEFHLWPVRGPSFPGGPGISG